jgi:hypothetical protein
MAVVDLVVVLLEGSVAHFVLEIDGVPAVVNASNCTRQCLDDSPAPAQVVLTTINSTVQRLPAILAVFARRFPILVVLNLIFNA